MLPRGRLARQRVSFAPVSTSLRRSLAVSSGMMRTAPRRPKPLAERVLLHLGYRGGRTRTCNPRFWRPVLCQLSYAPRVARAIVAAPLLDLGMAPPPPRPALGALFLVLAIAFAGIAAAAAEAVDSEPRPGGARRGGRGHRALAAHPRVAEPEEKTGLGRILYRWRRRDAGALARVRQEQGPGSSRPAHPHVRAARQVRRRTPRERPARARRRERPRLVRPPGPDRGDRALRPEPRHQVRDLRHRAHQGLDHRRAARDGLGSPLGPISRARHRAGDRGARAQAPPRADRRGDRGEARDLDRRSGRQPDRDRPLVDRSPRRALDDLVEAAATRSP